jgi:hypothetical protein
MRSVDQRDESLIYEALGVACSLTHSTRIGCLVGTVLISMSVELFAMACSKHWGSRPLPLPHPAKSKQLQSGSGNMCDQDILVSNFSTSRFSPV